MDRKHHYTCRCNDCVRQRNARNRRSEQQYAERGTPLPTGSIRYEIMGDHPIIYDDSFVATPRYRSPSEVHPPACTCVDCNAMRRNNNREPPVQPANNPSSRQRPAPTSYDNSGVGSQQPRNAAVPGDPVNPVARKGRMGGIIALLLLGLIIGGIVYGAMRYMEQSAANPVAPEVVAPASPTLSPTPLPVIIPQLTATLPPTLPPTPTPPPIATPEPTPTIAPTPTATATVIMPTEREIVINAFAGCNGQYLGDEKRRRLAAVNSAIDRNLHSVASIRALVEEKCGGAFPNLAIADSQAAPTPTSPPRPTLAAAVIVVPTLAPITLPTTAIADAPRGESPASRHIAEKQYMLELINAERKKTGLSSVTLGDNTVAQLHAEAALENCFHSHWGVDGLKPYMRYSLAGGYQSNGENGLGLNYCITATDGYTRLGSIRQEIREAIASWMGSPGHRRNLLDPSHRKMNIGIAWDRYNTAMYQHFEGDYVEYDGLPTVANGVLSLSGTAKQGVRFGKPSDLDVQIYYDPPQRELTRGQVARTYCYDNGQLVASLRWPVTGGYRWTTHKFTTTHQRCASPYDVPDDAPAPNSYTEAHLIQRQSASQMMATVPITVPWVTASKWTARGKTFAVTADISKVLSRHGNGIYSLMVWGKLGGEDAVISQYSIFHGITPPDTYTRDAQ